MSERSSSYSLEKADPERDQDLVWINQNLEIFWPMSRLGYEMAGRGVLVIDAAPQQPAEPRIRHHLTYQPLEQVKQLFDPDVQRMVYTYDPAWEFVTVLFKGNHENTYRLRVLFANPS